MTSDQAATIAAFGSAIGSALTMLWYRRSERKRSDEECVKRLDALRAGLELGHRLEEK